MMIVINGEDLARVGFAYLGIPYSQMDCQAFVERCLSDLGLRKNLSGSNAWYRLVMSEGWVGSPEECRERFGYIPAGAFLFIHAFDGGEEKRGYHDGLGNASHIGIYTATGKGAINSSATNGCVCESKFQGKSIRGGWNMVGLWREVSYGESIDKIIQGGGSVMTATVYASSGSTVNMRSGKSTDAPLVDRIPIGDQVTVESQDTTWSLCVWNGKRGYVMNQYLIVDSQPDTGEMISVSKADLTRAYDILGGLLGFRG